MEAADLLFEQFGQPQRGAVLEHRTDELHSDRQAIGGLVRAASVRAGLTPHGPHRLRHTVATELQHRGAPLAEIAQLLRHQGVQTTAVYAKVDRRALSSLAQPWPGATG